MSKITLETISEAIAPFSWTIAPTSLYNNLDSQLEFICPNKHSVYNNWRTMRKKFEKGEYECPICAEDRVMKAQHQMTVALEDEHIPRKIGKRILGLD